MTQTQTPAAAPLVPRRVCLVIADISGYTAFVTNPAMTALHSEQVITELLEATIDAAEFPLTLNKLEGDAAFLFTETHGRDADATRDVARQVQAFRAAFRAKQDALFARSDGGCPCEACQGIGKLRLKAVLHLGDAAFKRIRQFEELAGPDVILVHRLLKNSVPARDYVLMTAAFHQASGGLPGLTGEERSEEYAGIGRAPIVVYYPDEPPTEAARAAAAQAAAPPDGATAQARRKPLTRPAGIAEMFRMSGTALLNRLRRPGRVFNNVPGATAT